MKKIRLLRITTETYSLHILMKHQLKYMGERGVDVHMASTYDSNVPELEKQQNAPFYSLKLSRKLTPIDDLISLYHAVKLIKKVNPDIVHTHSPKAGIIGMLAAWICRVPVKIHTVAGLPLMEVSGSKRYLLDRVEQFTYWCSDWVLPNSYELKKFIIDQKLLTNKNKISVIGKGSTNGINFDYFRTSKELIEEAADFREKHQIEEDDIVLSFVGRLANYKGVNELVHAFIKLKEVNAKVKLVLVGPFEELNPLTDFVKQEIKDNDSIIAVGHQKDIRKFLVASNLFVFPSYREGFPQALMQALAMGLPSIATDINGCNELVEHDVTGILIESKSVDAIVNGCNYMIENSILASKMGQMGQKYMQDHYDQAYVWDSIHHFYVTKYNALTTPL